MQKSVFDSVLIRRTRSVRTLLICSATILGGGALTTPVYAQEEAEVDDDRIIIVQARKQSETLQETPVTVTSLGADTLDRFQVNEVADVVSRIPALNVQVGGSGAGGQISLRGVGTTNISAAFDSAVAFDFDGVSISTMRLVQASFFDVEQIDVLKGPQSLFFGKSASAGVFSVRSANPTANWEVGGKASYEFEEEGYTVGGYISGPVSDTLGIRLAAQYQDIDKYVELEAGTPSVFADSGKGLKNFVGRLTLQWDPADNFSANLKLNYNHNEGDSLLGHSDIDCGANGVADDVFLAVPGVSIASNSTCDIQDGLYPHPDGHPSLQVIAPGTTGADRYNGQSYNETNTFFARLAMDLDVTDSLTLSSVTGILDLENEHLDHFSYVGILPDGSPGGLPAPFSDGLQQYTQEIRLASDFDGMFNFMVGGFWESRSQPLQTSQNAFIATFIFPDSRGITYDWVADRATKSEALSFFGSVSLDITDQLELSGGLRWTDEQKTHRTSFPVVHNALTFLNGVIGGLGLVVPEGFQTGPIKFSDSNISPEVTIKYQATPDLNIYASYKTGFKSGGIDNSILPTAALQFVTPGFGTDAERQAALDSIVFDSETAKGGEIGAKAILANGSFRINTAAYYFVFDDLQVQNFDGAAVRFLTINAGELTTKGFDVDWVWDTPLEGLSFSGALGYTDAKFTDTFISSDPDGIPGNADDVDLDGRRAARAPKWSGNVAVDLVVPMGDTLEFGLNGNAAYSGSYFAGNNDFDDFVQDSYVSLDAAVSVGDSDGKWKLSLIGVNLTDELWANTVGDRPFLPAGGDDRVVTQNRGRQIFVEAAFRF
ncbi:TonB-dependent receptor domain-containing protein [Sphingorhabdus sp. Alg231-15]|uniref:TonB-dependent receptor domain-containing protein n=1 Tax=Sphingorhabdus sp. Alg231-15 TaxID=1922222 RepID=UPI000D55CCCE